MGRSERLGAVEPWSCPAASRSKLHLCRLIRTEILTFEVQGLQGRGAAELAWRQEEVAGRLAEEFVD